jgi:5-methylcytosine-specific restriction protein B
LGGKKMSDKFTWIETYQEIASKLRTFRENQEELLGILADLQKLNIPTIGLTDKDQNDKECSFSEIDPFTFFANFNRGIKQEARIEIVKYLIDRWNLSCPIPSDFSGIPVVNNQQSWFIVYKRDRGEQDVSLLWDLFEQAIDNQIDENTFNAVLGLKYIRYNITMGLFWISPERYLNLDSKNRSYLDKKGLHLKDLPDYSTYVAYMDRTKELLKEPFFKISYDA